MGVITHDNSFYPTPGTVPSWAMPVVQADSSTITIAADPGVNNRRGLVIFFHPTINLDTLGTPPAVLNVIGERIGSLATSIAAKGWVVALPTLPCDRSTASALSGTNEYLMAVLASNDPGTGSVYMQAVAAQFDRIKLYLLKKYNIPSAPIIVGGFSLGAHAAACVAINRTSSVIGYFCHCLPTLWQNIRFGDPPGTDINPLASITSTSGMDLGATSMNGLGIPGIIGWNNQDTSVGWSGTSTPVSNVASIITNSGATSYESSTDEAAGTGGVGHLLLDLDGTQYANWINTNFNQASGNPYPVFF